MGLAYAALALPSSSPITPLFDVLVNGGVTNSFGLQMCDARIVPRGGGYVDVLSGGGFLQLGAQQADVSDLFTGQMQYAPITRQLYYETTILDVAFNGTSLGVPCSLYNSPRAIVDR